MAEKRPLAFIRSTICPESNSNVKREMRIFGDRGDLLKKRIVTHSGLRSPSPSFFPSALNFPQTMDPATAAKSPAPEVKVGYLPITGGVLSEFGVQITIIVIMLIPLTQVRLDPRLRGATDLSQDLEGVPREVRR